MYLFKIIVVPLHHERRKGDIIRILSLRQDTEIVTIKARRIHYGKQPLAANLILVHS